MNTGIVKFIFGATIALAIALLFFTLAMPTPARAAPVANAVVQPPCGEAEFNTAFNSVQSSGGGTITFNCGAAPAPINFSSVKVVATNTTIDGGNVMTLSGGNATRLFVVNGGVALTLNNITISNGSSNGDDGGAIRNNGTLNVTNAKFLNNQTTSAWSGGAIVSYGPLNITKSEFGSNQAGNGGAIYPRFSGAVTTITGSNFHDNTTINTTNGWGGAMLLWDGAPVTITNSTLSTNTAQQGGAIYVFANSSLTFDNSLVASNVAKGTSESLGGGIYNKGTVTLTNVSLSGNMSAQFDGGGIANFGTLTLNGSTLSGNTAADFGGGMANFGMATVNTSTFSGNVATGFNGGGIYNFIGATTTVNNSLFSNNSASAAGGAVSNDGTVTLTNSTLSSNSARNGFGGGVENLGQATLNKVTLSSNSAKRGGGIDTGGGGTMTVTNSTLSGNSTDGDGGGLYNTSTLNLSNSTLSGNSAAQGGGIFNGGNSTLINVTLDNRVTLTGTAHNLYLNSGVLRLTNTIVNFNASSGANCFGAGFPKSATGGHNLANDTSCGLTATGDQQGPPVPILLGPLADHGGPTLTQLPRAASAAIDGGDNAVCAAPPINNFDQRGATRVGLGTGTACDIGAVERLASDSDVSPTTVQFSSASYTVGEGDGRANLTVTRSGDASAPASVGFATSDSAGSQPCNVFNGLASSRCDYLTSIGTLQFAAGETSKTISIPIIDDSYAEGNETFTVSLNNASGASLGTPSATTVTIVDNDTVTGPNPVDQSSFFVRQHYLDFLNREPDTSGLNFWVNDIESCGADANCRLVSRINVSAAFFLSIEFQQTGYLVERIYKASYGDATGASTLGGAHQLSVPVVRLSEFLPDTQEIGLGVIVNQGNWQQQLENNKQAFTLESVQRSRFTTAFPTPMTPAQFVDKLFLNAGVTPAGSERTAAINEFGGAATTIDVAARSRALRDVSENSTLNQQEFNRAFVLMQFFGYLRRNPNDAPDSDYTGYDFWLTKLNQFNGNYINAEMVKAFISSSEYRNRFGP